MTIDRFAEKYTSMNPYQYGANNPIKFIDVNGDSIRVAQADQKLMNQVLTSVFGDLASGFSYTSSGMLTFDGNEKSFKGKQRKVYKDPVKVMSESTQTNLVFGKSTEISLNDGSSYTLNASDAGGAVIVLAIESDSEENTLLIELSTR